MVADQVESVGNLGAISGEKKVRVARNETRREIKRALEMAGDGGEFSNTRWPSERFQSTRHVRRLLLFLLPNVAQ